MEKMEYKLKYCYMPRLLLQVTDNEKNVNHEKVKKHDNTPWESRGKNTLPLH